MQRESHFWSIQLCFETPCSDFVNRTLQVMFPGVAARYRQSKNFYENHPKRKFRESPLFGLYWCLCINGMFTGQKRIKCDPHIDFKNIVGVCALLVYQLPGKNIFSLLFYIEL